MKLIEAIRIAGQVFAPEVSVIDVALACGFTPLHFRTFLNAHLRREFPDDKINVITGNYADLYSNLECLEKMKADSAVVVVELQDLDPRLGVRRLGGWTPKQLPDIRQNVRQQANHACAALERISCNKTIALSLPTLPLPPLSFTATWQMSSFESDIRHTLADVTDYLVQSPNIRIVNQQYLDRISPPPNRFDLVSELRSGFPYDLRHADALAALLARMVRNPSPKKGLITDLDNTLWMGVLGEVGTEHIAWDLDHRAQKHGLYQQLLESIAEAGILIAVASKNDPALVEEAFQKSKPILSRNRIFPLEANWQPKSHSVGKILRLWNVGAESVVYVDDSPMDLAEVKSAYPEMECLLFPTDDKGAYRLLEDLRDFFGKQAVSPEDALRLESIRSSHVVSDDAEPTTPSSERFLEAAQGKLTLRFGKSSTDPRPLELINKTNQFNLNGKRHTEISWRRYLEDPQVFLLVASYEDKFGPLGKIAVMAGRLNAGTLFVDHWVMSCRAFSRRIEYGCLLHLLEKFAPEQAIFEFIPTPRNGPLQELFAGFLSPALGPAVLISREQLLGECPPLYFKVVEAPGD